MSHPICDLTKCECKFGGVGNFNLGFMRGTEDVCRHPKIPRSGRSLYLWDGRPRFPCPLGKIAPDASTNGTASASEGVSP